MVKVANRSKNQYSYYCDMCEKKITYSDNTLFQLHVKTKPNKSKKLCELCDSCYKRVCKAIAKERRKNREG